MHIITVIILVCTVTVSCALFIALPQFAPGPGDGGTGGSGISPPGQQDGGAGPGGDGGGAVKSITEIVAGKVAACVSENPSLTEEQCWDLKYHDTAIAENNRTICDFIISENIRQHCTGYFR